MALEERPREKMLAQGENSLSNAELLAIILRTGTKQKNVIDLANYIINKDSQGIRYLQDITIDELIEHVKAPDFPTGGIIYGTTGVREAFHTGRGKVKLRAKTMIEEGDNGRMQIVVTEVPYQVNKANMIKKTADLVNDKKIDGISEKRKCLL